MCVAPGCIKFARLSACGVRRFCINHMKEHGLMPKEYEYARGTDAGGTPSKAACKRAAPAATVPPLPAQLNSLG